MTVSTPTKGTIHSFTDLHCWKEGHIFVLLIYKLTENFPSQERFGLTSQLRRAAVSVTSNIAEGFCRKYPREKLQFYSIALSSLIESQNQLIIAKDVRYLTEDTFQKTDEQRLRVAK